MIEWWLVVVMVIVNFVAGAVVGVRIGIWVAEQKCWRIPSVKPNRQLPAVPLSRGENPEPSGPPPEPPPAPPPPEPLRIEVDLHG